MILIFLTFFLSTTVFFAQEDANDMSFMREYFFVELIRIPDRPSLDSATTSRIQKAHLDNIDSLHKAGKLLVAGPFGDEKGGGIFVLNAETLEDAIKMCESDPAIKNKRLNYKVRPWWTDKRVFTAENED